MAQQIAGAVPRVAFLEDVAQDFAVGGLFVAEVSQELVFDGFGVELRDELAWLVVCAASAQACLWVSQRLICFMVESEESFEQLYKAAASEIPGSPIFIMKLAAKHLGEDRCQMQDVVCEHDHMVLGARR